MDHNQNQDQFFSKITKGDHELLRTLYFIRVSGCVQQISDLLWHCKNLKINFFCHNSIKSIWLLPKIYWNLWITLIDTLGNIFEDISSTIRTRYRSKKLLYFHQFSFSDQFLRLFIHLLSSLDHPLDPKQ